MSIEINFGPNTFKSNVLAGIVAIIIHPITLRHLNVDQYACLYNAITMRQPQ